MNLAGDAICEFDDPAADRALPTAADISAAIELYRTSSDWTAFAPLGRDIDPNQPLQYSLAEDVFAAGSPAVASSGYPQVQVYVLGSDKSVYYKFQDYDPPNAVYKDWGDWVSLGCCFDGDPAAVSWGYPRMDLFARSVLGIVQWRSLTPSGQFLMWGEWKELAPLDVTVASAPAVTSRGRGSLDLFVRGGDDYLYWSTYDADTWSAWTKLGDRPIAGKPAVASTHHDRIDVVAAGQDGTLQHLRFFEEDWDLDYVTVDGALEAETSPALAASVGDLHLFVHAPQTHHLLERVFEAGSWGEWRDLGGRLQGSPGALGFSAKTHVEVAAQVGDAAQTGIWLRSWPSPRPCLVAGDSCGTCAEPCNGHCPVLSPPLGNPSFHIDAAGNDAWTFRTTDQHLYRITGVADPVLLDLNVHTSSGPGAARLASDPQAYVRYDGIESIAYTAVDQDIYEVYRYEGAWASGILSQYANAPYSAGPAFPYRRSDGYNSVVFRGLDQEIHEIYLYGGRWYSGSLTGYTGASLAAGDPKPFIRADNGNAVIFRTPDGELHEIYLLGFNWFTGNLSLAAGAVAAQGDGYGYVRSDLQNAVVYRGVDSDIYELLAAYDGHTWAALSLTAAAGMPKAKGDARGYVRSDGVDAVVYAGVDDHVYELRRVGASWEGEDISAASPTATGDPIPYVRSDGTSAMAYLGTDQRLHELMLENDTWVRRTLYEAP